MPIAPEIASASLPMLTASPDRRRVVNANGKTVFLLADAAWELLRRAEPAEAETYLSDRSSKGFNVVQAAVLSMESGQAAPNARGEIPFCDHSTAHPNETYFAYVDWFVNRAAASAIYTALTPIWSDRAEGASSLFTPGSAAVFGEWLGRRYRDLAIIWTFEQGVPSDWGEREDIFTALARGLRSGSGGAHLIAGFAGRAALSGEFREREGWGDPIGHCRSRAPSGAPAIAGGDATATRPCKPSLPLLSVFEDAPIGDPKAGERCIAADVRRSFYSNAFRGACGYLYGHDSVWQFYQGRAPLLDPMMDWREGLQQPGARQVGIGARLLKSRPMESCEADDSILASSTAVCGPVVRGAAALRDSSRRWAMVYVPEGRPCEVRLSSIAAESANVWRFDPRTGAAVGLGTYPTRGAQRFAPPARGEWLDWILVLDDASCGWGAPGIRLSSSF